MFEKPIIKGREDRNEWGNNSICHVIRVMFVFGCVGRHTSVPSVGTYNVFLTVGHCRDTPLDPIPDRDC